MSRYDYYEEVKNDVINYINDEIDFTDFTSKSKLIEYLYDTLFIEDSVTGNASGSYFFNAYKAEEAICHNGDLIEEAYSEFGGTPDYNDPETIDVTIRCYILPMVIEEAIEEVDRYFI